MRVLGNRRPSADGDLAQGVQDCAVADGGEIIDHQAPRHRDPYGGVDVHMAADARAEQSQYPTTQRPDLARREREQWLDAFPKEPAKELTVRPFPFRSICRDIKIWRGHGQGFLNRSAQNQAEAPYPGPRYRVAPCSGR